MKPKYLLVKSTSSLEYSAFDCAVALSKEDLEEVVRCGNLFKEEWKTSRLLEGIHGLAWSHSPETVFDCSETLNQAFSNDFDNGWLKETFPEMVKIGEDSKEECIFFTSESSPEDNPRYVSSVTNEETGKVTTGGHVGGQGYLNMSVTKEKDTGFIRIVWEFEYLPKHGGGDRLWTWEFPLEQAEHWLDEWNEYEAEEKFKNLT